MLRTDQLERVRVVLVRTRNPLNMGAVARAMSNFGLLHLRVVQPFETAFRQARSAVGALDVLRDAEECANVAEAVRDCTLVAGTTAVGGREMLQPVLEPAEGIRRVREQLAAEDGARVALLFGSEKTGLSKDDISHCDFLLRIPTRGEHRSMNLGQAAAVCCYELVRTEESVAPAAGGAPKHVSVGELERMEGLLMRVLLASGYTEPDARVVTEQRVRRLLRRMEMGSADVEEWLGMLRKVVWKLEKGS